MNIKQIRTGLIALAFIATPFVLFAGSTAGANQNCGGVDTAIIGGAICDGVNNDSDDIEQSAIWAILRWVINIMAAGAAILAIGGIVYGAILYTSAAGSAEKTKKAKDVLFNVAIGIVAFALMWAFLQWLIPGGVF